MKSEYIFPAVLVILNVAAALVYAFAVRDWRMFVYYVLSAAILSVVTFGR